MFGKYGIDFGPEAHKGFSDREWKLACEFFDLMLHLPLTEDEDEWDSFFDWALSEVFDVDENTDHEVAFAEAEDALEWLRGLFEEDPEQNEIPFDPLSQNPAYIRNPKAQFRVPGRKRKPALLEYFPLIRFRLSP